MICFPNAKINIGLNITSKRSDGFHEIESVFYPVKNLKDALEVIENTENNFVEFTSSGIEIPGDASTNLCVKAYYLIKEKVNVPPVKIHLHKTIPIGAGMGGGSADAAFFIQLMNTKFNLNMSYNMMYEIATTLGSDCAFFLDNTPAYVTGRGEILEPINLNLTGKKIVIVYPNIHISTKEAYAGVVPQKLNSILKIDILKPITEWKNTIKNDFETSIFKSYPILKSLKESMYVQGAEYACMSGSGSTIFGVFNENVDTTKLSFSFDFVVFDL